MSKVNRADYIFCHVDSRFDELNIIASEDRPRTEKAAPHCDCREAIEHFFGVFTRSYHDTYTMVPLEGHVTRDGYCKFCGYVAFLQPRVDLRNRKNSQKSASRVKSVD